MVKKKNGFRSCCDFRPLNEVTIKDAYPLPRIDESLGKAKIYTSIDLARAFWQIPVRKADRHKSAFACQLGLFQVAADAIWHGRCFCKASNSTSATENCQHRRQHGDGLH